MTYRILNAEPAAFSPKAQAILEGCGTVTSISLSRADLKTKIRDFDILIVRLSHCIDKEILEASADLKVIVTATTGLNHIDVEETEKRGITVLSLRGEADFLNTVTATAEHTMGLIFALIRHIPAAYSDVQSGNWQRDQFKGFDLAGKTLGIIGCGRLGKLVAHYGRAFGMDILAHDPHVKSDSVAHLVSLDTLLRESDIVSLHASYGPGVKKIMDTKCFEIMKKTAYFINTARGELIDEKALLEALKNNKLAGAALDVLSNEHSANPEWIAQNPLVQYARQNSNLIITPHIGGATYDSMEKTEIFMAQKLSEWLKNAAAA